MKITIYELLGLIKDGKQPKHISIDGTKLFWNGKTYQFETGYCTLSWDCYIEDNQLNYEVAIIEEIEDKGYEDIEELDVDKEGKEKIFGVCSQDRILADKINQLIRNQKKILERLDK